MKGNKIKFGIIGCGYIGKRHAAMVTANPECELVAMCDILPEKDLGLEEYNVDFFTSAEAMLSSDLEFDIVSICSPNGLHGKHGMMALKSGRHIVCEKPMALHRIECEEIIHTALNQRKQVFCVMQNRYSPPSEWIKKVVSEKMLGEIYMVEINCYWNRDDRYYFKDGKKHPWKGNLAMDGGTLYTQFSHFIDIMYWLFGDIRNIGGRMFDFRHGHSTDFEDSGMVHFDFIKGGAGCLTFSTAVWGQNLESSMTIIGEKGSVKVGGQYMNDVVECNIEGYEMPELAPTNPGNFYGHYWGSAANHHYIFENIVDVLLHDKEATTNALEGMKVVEIIEKIYEATRGETTSKSLTEKELKSV